MEEENFEVRVKRLFGSHLFSSVPASGFPATSWSVASGEVERRGWNRERGAAPDRDADPCASSFDDKDACFANKSKSSRGRRGGLERDLDDGDDDGERIGREEGRVEDEEREVREIRSSIGLDPTLDHEEEEDEYDRAAFHKENAGDRVYLREINDHGPYLNSHTVLDDLWDDSIEEIHRHHRDPRADHFAASVRLNEDQKAAESCPPLPNHSIKEPFVGLRNKVPEFDTNLKPILKRREGQVDLKPKKRVRFDAGCKVNCDELFEEHQDTLAVPQSMETTRVAEEDQLLPKDTSRVPEPKESHAIPDYVRNPSKYTCYTFHSSDNDDDAINKHAFEDLCNLVKRSSSEPLLRDKEMDLPKSVTFTPRNKGGDPMAMDDKSGAIPEDMLMEPAQILARSIGIAAGEADESEACGMEEDDVEDSAMNTRINSRKQVRQYRSKSSAGNAA